MIFTSQLFKDCLIVYNIINRYNVQYIKIMTEMNKFYKLIILMQYDYIIYKIKIPIDHALK